MRPLFAILSAKLFSYNGNNHIKIATAVELIHSATLLHDDIIDESKTRRGKISVNEKWGNKYAVLVGDFLFSQSFKIMVSTKSIGVLDTLAHTSAIIAEGEIKQLNNIGKLEIKEEEYIQVISDKTAELFAAACKTGAIIAGQNIDTQNKMYLFGKYVGISFQIVDDILDYTSSETGKDIGNDLKEKKVTLPLIFAYSKASNADKEKIKSLFTCTLDNLNSFEAIKSLLHKYESFEQSKKLAFSFINRARDLLLKIPKSKKFDSIISDLLDYQIQRIS